MKISLSLFGAGAALASLLVALPAQAESERGPFFVEGHVGGITLSLPGEAVGVAYPLEVGFGYHVMGTHEGFVVGLVQRFDVGVTGGSTGATLARLGWDFAIPLDPMELTLVPYVQGGVLYAFEGGDPGGLVGAGFEGRLFPFPVAKTKTGEAPVRTKRVQVRADRIEIKEKIQFKANEAVIEEVSFPLLEEIASVIRENPHIRRLRVEGHASSEGDAAVNQSLSEARAEAVKEHLVTRGKVSESVLESKGYGASKPIADNETDEGREQNRRVELNILEQDKTMTKLVEKAAGGPEEGFFIAVKPIEVDVAIAGEEVVPVLTFQAGVGIAF
jgi:outer membrane protein OmpA-like peptidoglycan-associated protein